MIDHPRRYDAPVLGASAAVYAIAVNFAIRYPSTIFYLYAFIPMRASWMVTALVAWDVWGWLSEKRSTTSHAGHVGVTNRTHLVD